MYGRVSLVLREVAGAFGGNDSLDWSHFEEIAASLQNLTLIDTGTKTYVRTLAKDSNSTIVAYWAVTWAFLDAFENNNSTKDLWSAESPNAPNSTSPGGGGKVKRWGSPLARRQDAIMLPIHSRGLPTGFKMILYKGSVNVAYRLLESTISYASGGIWFDSGGTVDIVGTTIDNEEVDAGAAKAALEEKTATGPYYRQLEYLPTIMKRYGLEVGLQIVMEETWAASTQAVAIFGNTLWMEAFEHIWQAPR